MALHCILHKYNRTLTFLRTLIVTRQTIFKKNYLEFMIFFFWGKAKFRWVSQYRKSQLDCWKKQQEWHVWITRTLFGLWRSANWGSWILLLWIGGLGSLILMCLFHFSITVVQIILIVKFHSVSTNHRDGVSAFYSY